MRRAVAAMLVVSSMGCFVMHSPGDEGAGPADGGADTGTWSWDAEADGPCAPVGGYLPCDGECERECPNRARFFCAPELGVCYPFHTIEEDRGGEYCNVRYRPSTRAVYCYSGNICAVRPTEDMSSDSFGGLCVRPEFCDEVDETELGAVCRYSDGTTYEEGPPEVEECPEGNPLTPFCGGPCDPDGCPFTIPPHRPGGWEVSCVGISETRGIGVCALHTKYPCTPIDDTSTEGCELYWGQPCLCLVHREGDGYRDWGWATMADSCRAYRDMYPGDFGCFDAEWHLAD